MRALIKLILMLILLSPVALAALVWLGFADDPLVRAAASLSHGDIERVQTLLRGNDPRKPAAGSARTLEVGAHDLNLLANYLVRQLSGAKARVRLVDRRLLMHATMELPQLPLRRYLNLQASLAVDNGSARIVDVTIGRIPIPDPVADAAMDLLISRGHGQLRLDRAIELVERVEILPDRLRIRYQWHPRLITEARHALLSGADRASLRHYHEHLATISRRNPSSKGSLMPLLTQMFKEAEARSATRDPVAENTALLTVLGAWASRQGHLRRLVPESKLRPRYFRLKLFGRYDLAQHLLISAALAARGDGSLSDAVGLLKEINDADHGSGFSFTDIAADRAGTRFGRLAVGSKPLAHRFQRLVALGLEEADIMPLVRDLPEHLDSAEFRRRFDRVGSPAYAETIRKIDRRIAACRLYADLGSPQ